MGSNRAWVLQMIPPWWIWYYWICPIAWVINGLVTSQLGDVTTLVSVLGSNESITVQDYVKKSFGFERSFLKWTALGLAGWAVFFALLFVLGIKFLNFQRR